MYFLKKTTSTQPQLNIDVQLEALPGSTSGEKLIRCDWGTLFKCDVTQSTTVRLIDIKKGQTVVVLVKSSANNSTINFKYLKNSVQTEVSWLDGSSNGGVLNTNEVAVYTFTMVDDTVYGSSSKTETTGAEYLSQLLDVTLSSPTDGQALLFNGTNWVNSNISNINNALYVKSLRIGEQVLTGTNIDWSQGNSYFKTVTTNESYTFSNTQNGQMITVTLITDTSDVTVSFPSSVVWVNGEQQTQRLKAGNKFIFKFVRINNVVYGAVDREIGPSYIRGVVSAPVSLTGNTVDCDVGSYFTTTITANTTFTINNLTNGQCVCLVVSSSGGSYTVTFSIGGMTIKWADGNVQNTVADGKTNIYVLLRIGNVVYISYSNNY